MDFSTLKAEIKEIADIASEVPERFRDKCFEVLLANLLSPSEAAPASAQKQKPKDGTTTEAEKRQEQAESNIPTPSQIRVLMSKTGVVADDIGKMLFVEDGEVHFVREPSHTTVSKGQIEWALLLALKSGLLNNILSADPEEVRSVCQDKGFYDKGNFATNFKGAKAKKLFKNLMEPQGDPQTLTADGQEALGTLIKSLAGAS